MTDILKLHGHITREGKLEVELPPGISEGEVEVTIEIKRPSPQTDDEAFRQRIRRILHEHQWLMDELAKR